MVRVTVASLIVSGMLGFAPVALQAADEAAAKKAFTLLDADKSGALSEGEYTAGKKDDEVAAAKAAFKALDADASGSLSFAEFLAGQKD